MTRKFITLDQARKRVVILQKFIELVEGYDENTVNQIIIKQYAITSSLSRVAAEVNKRGYSLHGDNYSPVDIGRVLKTDPGADSLHRLVRAGYLAKSKHLRKKGI